MPASSYRPANPESAFTYGAPQLKVGHGAADEIGYGLAQTGAKRVLVVTGPGLAATGSPQRVADQMTGFGIEAVVFDGSHVEPTDESLEHAVGWARDNGPWDAIVAVGGGASIRTPQAVHPPPPHPREPHDYRKQPGGGGKAP